MYMVATTKGSRVSPTTSCLQELHLKQNGPGWLTVKMKSGHTLKEICSNITIFLLDKVEREIKKL